MHGAIGSPARCNPLPVGAADEDDAILVMRAKREPAVFGTLYLRYVDAIYRYCYRRLGDAESAADATSQIFAKAIVALPGCQESAFRSWLFAIAHNVLIDLQRTWRLNASLETAADLVDPSPSPEELALVDEAREELSCLLARLSADQRHVVELRMAGLNGNEIGEILGRQRGAIDAIQCRAMARLRSLLGVNAGGMEERNAPGR